MVSSREAVSKEEFEHRAVPLLNALSDANREDDINAVDANLGALRRSFVARRNSADHRLRARARREYTSSWC